MHLGRPCCPETCHFLSGSSADAFSSILMIWDRFLMKGWCYSDVALLFWDGLTASARVCVFVSRHVFLEALKSLLLWPWWVWVTDVKAELGKLSCKRTVLQPYGSQLSWALCLSLSLFYGLLFVLPKPADTAEQNLPIKLRAHCITYAVSLTGECGSDVIFSSQEKLLQK